MNMAKIELYVDDSLTLNVTSVQANGRPLIPMTLALSTLFNNPKGDPDLILGKLILNHLRIVDPDKFDTQLGKEQIPSDDFNEDYGVVQRLIHLSLTNKIKVTIPTIDYLLEHVAKEDMEANAFFNESWPSLRKLIQSFD